MIGKPKYKEDDHVYFKLDLGEGPITFAGDIWIVDAYGTFEQNEEPSYDIMVEDWCGSAEPCLVKHVRESEIWV